MRFILLALLLSAQLVQARGLASKSHSLEISNIDNSNPDTEYNVRVTSFRYIDQDSIKNRTAKICGQVQINNPSKDHPFSLGDLKILLVVDHTSRNPGEYVVQVSPRGLFCHVVHSMTGRAQYQLLKPEAPAEEAPTAATR